MEKIKNYNQFIHKNNSKQEKQHMVFDSKYYFSNNKVILFIGSYDECIQFIILNAECNLELLPANDNLNENKEIPPGYNLAIIGSRNFNNFSFAKKELLKIITENKISVSKIISGGAKGSDKIAETFADKFNIPISVLHADWSIGRHAGITRNTNIIKESEYVIAFWDGKSKGTQDSIKKARQLDKQLFIVKINENSINEGVSLDDSK